MTDKEDFLIELSEVSRNMYYRRDGTPVKDVLEWAKEFNGDRNVRRDVLWWGATLSTVYLGLNHNWGLGRPLIFESMLFAPGPRINSLDMDRYSTEDEAIEGHKRMQRTWSFRLDKILFVLLRWHHD